MSMLITQQVARLVGDELRQSSRVVFHRSGSSFDQVAENEGNVAPVLIAQVDAFGETKITSRAAHSRTITTNIDGGGENAGGRFARCKRDIDPIEPLGQGIEDPGNDGGLLPGELGRWGKRGNLNSLDRDRPLVGDPVGSIKLQDYPLFRSHRICGCCGAGLNTLRERATDPPTVGRPCARVSPSHPAGRETGSGTRQGLLDLADCCFARQA